MSTEKLLLDLGGTNLRVGYGNDENLTIRDVSKVKVDSNEDIFKVVNNSITKNNINEIVFSAAGPRIENKISMTNRSLDLDGDLLAHELKIKNCFLLNESFNKKQFLILSSCANRSPSRSLSLIHI